MFIIIIVFLILVKIILFNQDQLIKEKIFLIFEFLFKLVKITKKLK